MVLNFLGVFADRAVVQPFFVRIRLENAAYGLKFKSKLFVSNNIVRLHGALPVLG